MAAKQQKNLFGEGFDKPEPWELAEEADRWVAQVVLNVPVDKTFDYLVPDPLRDLLRPGQRVLVPFGRGDKPLKGFCVGVGRAEHTSRKLKEILEVLDAEPLLDNNMLELTKWIGERYLCGWGQVLESVVPAGVKNKAGTREVKLFELPPEIDIDELKLPAKQKNILQILRQQARPMRGDELADAAGCGVSPIKTLQKKGLLLARNERQSAFDNALEPIESVEDLKLDHDQQVALDRILQSLRGGTSETILLHGVTGSGKTEVYIRAIREVVEYGRQAIVLVPEISLTPQTIRRFRSRFDSVAVLHSHLSDAERHWHWKRIAGGEVQVIVGARSAIFAPTPRLGLIIIDEEHETSFKQETTPRYHAREVARRRAELSRIPLILGTATPTLESWRRVEEQRDVLISMPKRVNRLPMPPVVIVDTRNDPEVTKGAAIGRALRTAIRAALEAKGQVILFLNLRGFSPAMWCRACGESVRCSECDITLTWHKDRQKAVCHICGAESDPPRYCPNCNQAGLRYVGTGTQRLEQEVKARFPGVPCLRMDSDSMKKPGSHDIALEAFRKGDVKILLGTQMIAKGLDFPNVTLVGVIDADTALHQGDLRASERTFHLLAQVAGRTGRSTKGGRVLVQTSNPTEPAIVAAANHDYVRFAHAELLHRREFNYPPYTSLTRIILRGEHEHEVEQSARHLAETIRKKIAERELAIRVLGPAPAPIARLKKFYRYHFQIIADNHEPLRDLWLSVRDELPNLGNVEYQIDVDALNMR
ncbi:MAG TPA: primosomal protein N' [Planctomycetaceae bacterium]|nr:primosomal protein N' [Planctomycetaceae bacterium]